jgi:hypothetical protein
MPMKKFQHIRVTAFWELTKETQKVSKSIRSNRNYSAILTTPSVAEIAE